MSKKGKKTKSATERAGNLPEKLNFSDEIINTEDVLKLIKRVEHTSNFDNYFKEKLKRLHKTHDDDDDPLDDWGCLN